MEQMLQKSCYDMVVKDGHTDPEIIPADIYQIRGKTAVLDISMKQDFSMKQDNSMAVNKASLTSAIIPATPDSKTSTKRRTPASPDNETTEKPGKR
ncbi:hypothetical protein HanIR_Chr02g0082221 [Helianthus annuus]|nr:hypothetical protein HanIR_Chr02g0082221 [Helianthus annuus]